MFSSVPIKFSVDKCTDACGFLAAFIGSICYGSYGVPIKAITTATTSKTTAPSSVGDCPHPLILQTYKTIVVFITSWLIVLLHEEPTVSSYGIISGLLWVCGGTMGIIALQNVGIATSVGTWSSTIILVNFTWGILIFREPVHSVFGTCCAFVLLGLGLIGMTKSTSPQPTTPTDSNDKDTLIERCCDEDEAISKEEDDNGGVIEFTTSEKQGRQQHHEKSSQQRDKVATPRRLISRISAPPHVQRPQEMLPIIVHIPQINRTTDDHNHDAPHGNDDDVDDDHGDILKKKGNNLYHSCLRRVSSLTQRQVGVMCAVLNGLLGGSALVPLHYAKDEGLSDLSYFVSFTSGALVSNIALWVLYFVVQYIMTTTKRRSIATTYQSMPRWHFQKLWLKLLAAGLLLSGGMFGSILATSSLGQAVGNSLIQSKILVSGLFGICCFHEIKDRRNITHWFLSAMVCVASIIWLSFERRRNSTNENEEAVH